MKKVLLVDNYDSFTYNLAQYFGELGCELTVVRNDAITVAEAQARDFSHLVISPGPGEMTRCEKSRFCASARVIASLRTTVSSQPSSPKYWARLYVKES